MEKTAAGNGEQEQKTEEITVDLTHVTAIMYSPGRKQARVFGPGAYFLDYDDVSSVIVDDEVEVFNFSANAAGGIGSFSDDPIPDAVVHACFSVAMTMTQDGPTMHLAKTNQE